MGGTAPVDSRVVTDTNPVKQPPLIRFGDQGLPVADVQQRLARLGFADGDEHGIFGDRTRDAVRQFQRRRRLPADGIVGPETWRALVEAGYGFGDRLLWHSAVMMRGDDVLELQQRLNQLGFDAGLEDGIFGPLTRAAVEEFQRNIGLTVDGVAGPSVLETLRRLRRDHQSVGVGARAREREALRAMARRELPGARLMVDPAYGPDDPPIGDLRPDVATWDIAARLSGRLSASGADVALSRGPATTPSGSDRARLANELGVDIVVSISVNRHTSPTACGASSYYFGTEKFVSEVGMELADCVQERMTAAGWLPDCRTHPMTWAILRETRMPALVVQPGFLTSPADVRKLHDPAEQDRLADAVTAALAGFYSRAMVSPGA
jgi:N-acetylmuramoyl-L-alanine amidase